MGQALGTPRFLQASFFHPVMEVSLLGLATLGNKLLHRAIGQQDLGFRPELIQFVFAGTLRSIKFYSRGFLGAQCFLRPLDVWPPLGVYGCR